MFKQRSKSKEIILSVILVGSLLFTPLSAVNAGGTDINQGLRNIWDKVEKYVEAALKTSVLSALMNVATMTTQKLAYDAAMYLTAGGSGQQSLFEPRGWKEYGKMLSEQAMGEFVGSLAGPWQSLGLNICEPSPLQKLEFQKAFTKDINVSVPKLQMANMKPPAPKCDWSKIKSSYTKLAQSVKDFEVDMSLDLNVNLTQGETMTTDQLAGNIGSMASNAQQSLNTLSAQLTSLTEKLYGQGIDLTKLWLSTTYIKKLLNPQLDWDSLDDEQQIVPTMDAIFDLRKAVYAELDKKVKNLEKSLKGERKDDVMLNKTLNEESGDLYFWKKFRMEYVDAYSFGNEDNIQAVLDKYLLNDNYLNKLLRQQLWDRLLVMQLIADKKITNDLIKYVYYNDIDKYVKSSGDGLSSFVSYIQPGNNPSSVGMALSDKLSATTAQYAQKAQELADNKGFKAVTDVVSGRVKTPAELVQEQYKQTTIKDPSATKQTTLMGAYSNAGVGMALLNTAVNTFTSTVFNNLMNKVYSGLFKPDQMIANDGVSAGLTQSQLAKKLSANINIQMVSVKTEMTDYNVLNEYAICPEKYANSNNCVIDGNFLQALQGDQPKTLREAVDEGLINADWYILPKSHSLNADQNCFEKAFCYGNLQKLRHARIISTGWELVADLCENKDNSQYCSVDKPFTLKEALDNFYNCGQDINHPYHILCNLIDPNWLLKLPAQKCQAWGYGPSVVDPNMPDRQQYCADDVSCVQEDGNGACQAWGYCTREKNVWRFSGAQTCLPEQDSCRSFADSQGRSFSFLKNTLLLDDFNTCNSENIGCAWYSKNKVYDEVTGTWQWQDNFNDNNEATDRIYLTAQTPTCSANNEGCSKLVRALPRLGTNLLPNSDFSNFVNKNGNAYFESWKLSSGDSVSKHNNGALLTVKSGQYGGLRSYQPINIIAKKTPRYFIYSATLLVPQSLLSDNNQYNWDSNWILSVDAYKPGNSTPKSDYIYDVFGSYKTNSDAYYPDPYYDSADIPLAKVDLTLRFTIVPDVDRLSVAVLLAQVPTNAGGNQVIIKNLQLEEVGATELTPSPYKPYASDNLVYLKKAPDYYQCYQNWYQYNESECLSKNGYWDPIDEKCEAPDVCSKFAPYCSIDEVGCSAFLNLRTGENYNMVVSADDYCPAVCEGYEKLYEVPSQFSEGRFVNLIANTATVCPATSVGCEEFTGVSDDGTLENKYYFAYTRTCQLAGASDCQTFYTWDNPDGYDKTIKSYTLKAFNNQPVVTEDDRDLCNEDIYNEGLNPYCYKFYAVKGGENIDLNTLESNAYVSYHLINRTVTCSNDCKPYRLTRQVTEAQCLNKGAGLNKFIPGTGETGTCTVYAILDENDTCSSLNVGCREYRGSRSHAYFTLLMETFENAQSANIWQGGARVKEAVQKEGYSWQNLGSSEVRVNIDHSLFKDKLYLLTFWARSATVANDKLQVFLNGAEQNFTEAEGISLSSNWQQYVLGPVQMNDDVDESTLSFRGMNVGNLFIDNVELREVNESYYFVSNSWNVSAVCDQIPDTNITVPGYMLGCDPYLDSYGYKHYLKSFTANCRAEAVGCELVIDTKNNLEGSDYTYNKKPLKEIGNLVFPLVESEAACVTGGNIWERGHCHKSFTDSPISKKQCELWGYYWLGSETTGKCVNDTVADDITITSDKLLTLVLDQDYLCDASSNGCSAYGKAVPDADDKPITCDLGTVCNSAKGCACRQESTNDYICTVPIGQNTCQMDTIYAINNPLQYESTVCSANAKGCDKFIDSQNSIWYFRNPGNRLCEYKELRIAGQLKTGWFKKGTDLPCYPDYKPLPGLWGADQPWDYYLAGIDDLKNYDFYVGSCSVTANMCTKFVDPTADSDGQRNYYFLDNGGIDYNSCNGQVNLAEGCVLLNNTGKNSLTYSAEKTYAANFQADYQPVGPQVGRDDKSLNPLTGLKNPYYAVSGNVATAAGFIRVDLGNGIIQNYPYLIPLSTQSSSSSVNVLQGLSGLGSGNNSIVLPGSNVGGAVIFSGINVPSLKPNISIKLNIWNNDYAKAYQDVLGEMAKQGNEEAFVNNTNTVVKVQRDRSCAEWLTPADQETVYGTDGKAINTSFNLVSCQKMSSGECTQLAPTLPPQYLDYRLYALRGFGWNTLDYSGYSLPHRYSLADYKQIYLENEKRLALALDWKEACVKDSDCDVAGSRCLAGRCYDVKGSQTKYDLVSCRAYPESSSPFIYSLNNPILQSEQANRCYPMTGYCADQFSGTVKDYSLSCYSDLDCQPLQRCVFDNKATNDDCDCSYTKLTYAELGGINVYTGLNDDKLSNMGLCSGGLNDGLPCFGDNDCLGTQNRTMFRATSTLKVFQSEQPNGRCVFPSNAQKQQGWKGFCLEKDSAGQCITWWPVNRLLGNEDLYYKDKTVGLPYLNRYYCLHEDTLYKRLLVGNYNKESDVVCVDNGYSSDPQKHRNILRASFLGNTDIFYVARDEIDTIGHCQGRIPVVAMYPGAITKVEGKKFASKWDTDSVTVKIAGGGTTNDQIIDGPKMLEYIKNTWEGQSCFYMMLDVTEKYPSLYCDQLSGTEFDCYGDHNTPITVSCSTSDNIDLAEIESFDVPLGTNLADKVSLIKDLYLQYNNRCVIGWTTNGSRQEVQELFQRICEYQNIRQADYPLLFAGYNDHVDKKTWENVMSISIDFGKRFTAANIGGTEKICDLMAEVRDSEGNHMAYTDNFSRVKNLSLWNIQGDDYDLKANDVRIEATGTYDWYLGLGGSVQDYRVVGQGNPESNDSVEKIKAFLSRELNNYKILPIIVPRALVKNKIDLYTTPQPFGAIIGNNLYQPYVLPGEGVNLLSSYKLITDYKDSDGNNYDLTDNVICNVDCKDNKLQNRISAKMVLEDSDKVWTRITQNLLFSLFNSVYSLKEYRVSLKSENGMIPVLFNHKVMSKYVDSVRVFTDSDGYIPGVGWSQEYLKYDGSPLCMVKDNRTGLYKDLVDFTDKTDLTVNIIKQQTNNFGVSVYRHDCRSNYYVREPNVDSSGEEKPYADSDFTYLNLNKPRLKLLSENNIYSIVNNKQLSLDFYASADKNALPLRKIIIIWGDNQKIVNEGFIQNHQIICDSESFYDEGMVQLKSKIDSNSIPCVEKRICPEFGPCTTETVCGPEAIDSTGLSLPQIDYLSMEKVKYLQKSRYDAYKYGTCGPVCINWPQKNSDGSVTSGEEIKGIICYDTDKTKLAKLLGIQGTVIPPEREGEVYGYLYNQSVRCAVSDWDRFEDDLCLPVFKVNDGTFIDSLCESSDMKKVVFNGLDFYELNGKTLIRPNKNGNANLDKWYRGFINVAGEYNWNPIRENVNITNLFSDFRAHFNAEKRIYDLYTQGAAGESKNCVAKPFSFKHWYQNIVTINDDGKYVCNFGQAVDKNGNAVANESSDVVYCKLTGKIEIEDNMGKSTTQEFTVMVPTNLIIQSFPFLNSSLQMDGGNNSIINWVSTLNLGSGFVVPKPPAIPRLVPLSP